MSMSEARRREPTLREMDGRRSKHSVEERVLACEFYSNDLDQQMTVREFLVQLLTTLWEEEEGFSGKRPFGNSGWKRDVYYGLVEAGIVEGEIYHDPEGDSYLERYDKSYAEELLLGAINTLAAPPRKH